VPTPLWRMACGAVPVKMYNLPRTFCTMARQHGA
jgi:hypothetical protein